MVANVRSHDKRAAATMSTILQASLHHRALAFVAGPARKDLLPLSLVVATHPLQTSVELRPNERFASTVRVLRFATWFPPGGANARGSEARRENANDQVLASTDVSVLASRHGRRFH